MKKYLIYCIVPIIFYACAEMVHESDDTIVISPKYFIEKKYCISEFCEDIEYIPLDSSILIQRIFNIKTVDDLIFMSSTNSGVKVYNKLGKLISRIGQKGKGPGEYPYGLFFTLDKQNRRLFVQEENKILTYNFDGKYIREFKKEAGLYTTLEYQNNKLYGLKSIDPWEIDQPIRWYEYDTLGNLLNIEYSSLTSFNKNSQKYSITRCSYIFNDRIHYWNRFNDTIFDLSEHNIKAKYLFKNDNFRFKVELTSNKENFGHNKYYCINSINESNRYLFIDYQQYSKYFLCIFDKLSKKFSTLPYSDSKSQKIINDIDGGIDFDPQFLKCQKFKGKDYIIRSIPSIDLIEHVHSDYFRNCKVNPKKKKVLIKLANSLNENDNPILMMIKLKK